MLRNNYDPRAIYNDFKEQERHDGRIYFRHTAAVNPVQYYDTYYC